MRVPEAEFERRLNRFEEGCREAGLKLTHQRLEVFREVASTVAHPDAETVFNGVRERVPTVSLDTVYRTLWLLEDLGFISTLGQRRERARFDANLDSHHHFVCESCGLVRDFQNADFDVLEIPDSVKKMGSVSRVRIEFRGMCRECAGRHEGGEDDAGKDGRND